MLLAALAAPMVCVSATACTATSGETSAAPSAATPTPASTAASTTAAPPPNVTATAPSAVPSSGGSGGAESPTGSVPPPVVGAVSPVVTYAGFDAVTSSAQVAGYVDGVGPTQGTCTVILTMTGRPAQSTSTTATPDATTTQCGTLSIPRDRLTPGTWTAVLSFTSPDAAGHSSPATIEVPA